MPVDHNDPSDPSDLAGHKPSVLIMKGGGVKGLAMAGALRVLDAHGYRFDAVAGTSAGAIVAILLGAGYQPDELITLLRETEFRDFLDRGALRQAWNLLTYGGLHSGTPFSDWMKQRLIDKTGCRLPVRMEQLSTRTLVFAARNEHGLVEFDSQGNYASLDAHLAARCSMSIPLFFVPARVGEPLYDGGLLANFPLKEVRTRLGDRPMVALYLRVSSCRR